MKISGLIKVLQEILDRDGDLPVYHWDECGTGYEIDEDDVEVIIEKGEAVRVSL